MKIGVKRYNLSKIKIFTGNLMRNLCYFDTIVDKFNRYSIKKDIKKMDDIFNKNIKVILNEETLTIITVKGNTNVHLSAIEDVQIIKDCICIIFKGRSSLMIPKEAFKDKEDKINFEETVRGYSK